MNSKNRKGDSESPCSVPLSMSMGSDLPNAVLMLVLAPVYRFCTACTAWTGKPMSHISCSSLS